MVLIFIEVFLVVVFLKKYNTVNMNTYGIALHGGAGTLVKGSMTPELEKKYIRTLNKAKEIGFSILKKGGTALQAITKTICVLEDSPLFNAGKGSVFTANGTHEMDASIMDGKTLQAGAVSLVTGIKNPIELANDVMQKSEHVFLAGAGALQFAKQLNYTLEEATYFYDAYRYKQWMSIKNSNTFQLDHSKDKDSKFGTVGAVACDVNGNVAAGTSTGGMTNKKYGRIGDSPIIGAGNYANNKTCAVSCTGSGEYFIRGVVAYDVACLMEHKGLSIEEASQEVIQKRILELGGDGGLIAIDTKGAISMPFNTEGMYRACKTSNGKDITAIYG